jgi:SAM-dependent methyltransferase
MPTTDQLRQTLQVYGFPSQAYWRAFEVDVLANCSFERPILELGCASGAFTNVVCGQVEAGIDINPRAVEIARASGIYQKVRVQDARYLEDKPEFRTVFANSVLEHIPDLKSVLEGCHRVLLPGGKLITTVPLADMNSNLLFSSQRWVRYRQDRLSHVNLWTMDQWREALNSAGFAIERTRRYLSPGQIRLWDTMDGVAVVGTRRVNIGSFTQKVINLAPGFLRKRIEAWCCSSLSSHLGDEGADSGCCALLVAVKN